MMTEKQRKRIMEFLRNETDLRGDDCMKAERFLIDLQYKRIK